jgi:hypothetical protein
MKAAGKLQLWLAQVRHRADQIEWHADGTVILQFRELAEDQRIVPDATIATTKRFASLSSWIGQTSLSDESAGTCSVMRDTPRSVCHGSPGPLGPSTDGL